MANLNAPYGLRPVRDVTGRYWTGAVNTYYIASSYGSNLFVGDPVIPTGTSDANGIPGVTLATAGTSNYLLGCMVGIANGGEPIVSVTRDMPVYHTASTGQYIYVSDDPNTMYEVQEDGNMGVNSSMTNVNLASGSGSTATGQSGWALSSSSVATTATLQMRVLWPMRVTNNTTGASYCQWLARINLHSLANATGI